ncbi:MAG: hypothetical protein E7165_04060 [Firmicutes bacterium]|nr:hypothetical protein [Bacillota bacterium]
MLKIKLNTKKIFAIILSGFIIVTMPGCSSDNSLKTNYSSNGYKESTNYESIETNKTDDIKDTSNSLTVDSIDKKNEIETFTYEDKEVVTYFNDIKKNVSDTLNSEKVDNIKDKLKGTFIVMVDFIFYDGEIKGIKFDELTDGAKQNILETASFVDNEIMKKFPNYKEEISSFTSNAYNKASELIKSGAKNIKDFSKEKLGEENYNTIIEVKDELVDYTKQAFGIIGDAASTIWDKGTEKIKNWYENFKNH